MASRSQAVATAVVRRFFVSIRADGRTAADFPPRGRGSSENAKRLAGAPKRRGHAQAGALIPVVFRARGRAGSPPKRPYTARTGLLAMRCWGLSRLSSDVFLGEPPILALATFSKWGWGGVITRFSGCDAVVGGFWGRPEDLRETGKASGIFYHAATFVCEGIIIPRTFWPHCFASHREAIPETA